jgi:RNA polymerase sigma-70 factor (ECF subfamily)
VSAAFELDDWYRRFGAAVHRRAQRILGEAPLADDVVQETFLRAHRYRGSFRGGSALAWLFTIADRCALDAYGKASRLRPFDDDALRALQEDDSKEPTLGLEQRLERDAQVSAALAHADEETQRILLLRFLDELPTDAIAARLDLSERTVRRRLASFFDRAHGGQIP